MEDIVVSFRNSLSEIIEERNINIVELAKGISADPSTLHRWFNRSSDIKLKTLLKLADYFECSIEYLCGKTHEYKSIEPIVCKKFGIRIKEVINEYNLIPYKFLNQAGITPSRYYYWLSGGEPMLTALNDIALHLGITIDKLIGRYK